jgi:hypothetical protein
LQPGCREIAPSVPSSFSSCVLWLSFQWDLRHPVSAHLVAVLRLLLLRERNTVLRVLALVPPLNELDNAVQLLLADCGFRGRGNPMPFPSSRGRRRQTIRPSGPHTTGRNVARVALSTAWG